MSIEALLLTASRTPIIKVLIKRGRSLARCAVVTSQGFAGDRKPALDVALVRRQK
jgi:hypothetical protein